MTGTGASADLAALTGWPVIAVLDASRAAQTVAALAMGLARFRRDVRVAGVILNRVASPRHERLCRLGMEAAGLPAEIYVADSHVRYLKPLYADLHGEAQLEPGLDWDAFLRSFRERGRARAGVLATLRDPDGTAVAELSGRFAALRPA